MKQHHLDGALIFKPQNVYYLSGFNPVIQSHPVAVWIPLNGEPSLILHALRCRHAEEEADLKKLSLFGRWGVYGHNAPPDFWGAVEACFKESGISESAVLGVEEDHISMGIQRRLEKLIPSARLTAIDSLLFELRSVKDAVEIGLMEKACWIADQGMDAALKAIKIGVTEADVSVRAMIAMQEAWNSRYSDLEPVDFGTNEGGVLNSLWAYCLSGQRMNLMCDSSKSRILEEGDLVMVVIWTALNGYHSENERTVSVGPVIGPKKHAFETVLEAREKAQKLIRPGTLPSDVYRAAADVMTQKGYGDKLPGRIGHGLGLGAHEPFSLGPDNQNPLQEGMILSFEPAIRIGDQGGVQHSDTILVTSDGFRYLTNTERGMITVL